ncbi:hypothetical protein P175DRAFT_0165850 [Aspergillus ochraceoroseus IBT 24754]|uniref:RING-type domain-containing protein n=1 Tax=Aspergillus ochraceoroseus IBT 24754 TaxID=1392256 RepID=A0A2T5M443_9EURO|nr:uncharacterized protein P175DRAFT_0165850 [Aspergillus ochraceoroseus IBT 24754]PTU23292.1 hypothetical protein P175DRAFT_0165850 [Aspergillus ochraceoroseus IBT 24754]
MSARSLTTAATLFAGPGRASNSTASVNGSATFHIVLDGTIQTLSAENAPANGPIKGLLFVPTLESQDSCSDTTAPYIPANVTRLQDVASFGYQTIGLAPWVTPNCTLSFLSASQQAGSKALVFFLPSSEDSKPPAADDPTWFLGDGDEWNNIFQHPIYAIPGPAGSTLMEQLSWYSGNGTYPQNSSNSSITSSQNTEWDLRLFTVIDLEKAEKKAPSLWGFILAILGTILVLCIILLLVYQLIQKRRRETLQRRIEAGETDFEQYGLNQIKVPRDFLTTLPIYVYPDLSGLAKDNLSQERLSTSDTPRRSDDEIATEHEQPEVQKETETKTDIQTVNPSSIEKLKTQASWNVDQGSKTVEIKLDSLPPPSSPSESTLRATITEYQLPYPKHENRLSHSQTTCAICLDDFVPASSTVRELPCGHIYHPDCIDMSLTQSSSLCPLCKKSVLPPGYYPMPMTNILYRRDSMRRSW